MRCSLIRPRAKLADDISETPHAIVIRSLRRRLCQAFCEGNAIKALCIYKAQRSDWERWAESEKEAAQKSASNDLSRQTSNLTMQLTNDSQDEIGLLQSEMNPSEFFCADDYFKPNDPYNDEIKEAVVPTPLPKPKRREPFSMFRFGDKGKKEDDNTSGNDDNKLHMTTPLHEAARLGCGELVRLMLAHDSVDCQKRNGQYRTPLHMVAGGIAKEDHVGIGPLISPKGDSKPVGTSGSKLRTFFRRKSKSDVVKFKSLAVACSMDSRVDALRAIISWSEQREVLSTNSVDSDGRTALHYAAELGREKICHELLSSFGANLTIVDSMGMNPCEKAAEQNYHDLAAFLEAKAVLYIDPFGMDNELYESNLGLQHLNGFSRQTLTTPFSWFETLVDVQKERERRRDIMENKMKKILSLRIEKEEFKARILARGTMDDEVEWSATKTVEKSSDTPSGKPESLLDALRWFLGRVRSCHADKLLSLNEWNLKRCVERFYIDPIQMLKDAGLHFQPDSSDEGNKTQDFQTCLICCEEFNAQSAKRERLSNCLHRFCRDCLSDYVSNCAKSGMSCFKVTCPHHECNSPLLQSELADFASDSDYALLVDTSNADFVVGAYDVRYCPHPGCAGVVQFNASVFRESIEDHLTIHKTVGAVCTYDSGGDHHGPLTYEGVCDTAYYGTLKQPKLAHRFCFNCGESMHWPVSCRQLEEWNEVVKEHVQEVSGVEDSDDYKDVAQKLWMRANTRPCPKCQAPIQKSDGCNHMTCRGCRYEYCWICSGDWKHHTTETGGFFRCNRWIDQKDHEAYGGLKPDAADIAAAKYITDEQLADPTKMEVTYGTAMHEARVSRSRTREMGRFLHHYRRWNAHCESAVLERNMRDSAIERLAPVVKIASQFVPPYSGDFNFGGQGLSFIHAAFTELLECRATLQHSYAYLYVQFDTKPGVRGKLSKQLRTEKRAVERIQAELETMTEQLSDVVARSHLRATQMQILFLTSATAEKRKEFSSCMITILAKQLKRSSKDGTQAKSASRDGREGNFIRNDSANGDKAKLHRRSSNGSDDLVVGDGSSREDIEADIRASLARFMKNTGELDVLRIESDNCEDAFDDKETQGDWPCLTCTYVNCQGFHCAICGTSRRELSGV
ncbi:hypothetical protein FisN_22Lh256 [Fistulifera solaris]|uniref:RBR-type E3 ubiquitin transferase n=1 Tax=Fistulifera solaris TaxID=1519565 RepID=A0A1Z5JC32_FISSO|nr:hypothetical protein FisN_22Lh256 [Fistulifera solaris]|eukprot:GAX11563.1 hypothetical protein FisN_22Lh256 [Fistulifera solaris]